MAFIDLKSARRKWDVAPAFKEERANELRQDHFLPADRLSFTLRIPTVRAAIQRKLQDQKFLMLGPVSMHGLRPAHLSRKPSRYSGLPASIPEQTLPFGHSRPGVAQHTFKRQSSSGLTHLRRLCPDTDCKSQKAVCPRVLRRRVGP